MIRAALLMALVLVGSTFVRAEGRYVVTVDVAAPLELKVTFDLPKADSAAPRRAFVRGAEWGLKSQVVAPRCGGQPLLQAGDAAWIVPADCGTIAWTVAMATASDGELDVSAQASAALLGKRIWLLSEPTSLLRIDGDASVASVSIRTAGTFLPVLGATQVSSDSWKVPSVNKAPEFYVLGHAASAVTQIGPLLVRYVRDEPARISSLKLEHAHKEILQYLTSVVAVPRSLSPRDRTLLVVWIGIKGDQARSGGAAGHRSFLANYAYGAATTSFDRARTLSTIAHEQFHQLVDMSRGDMPALPAWFSESIATYYGLKAMASVSRPEDSAEFRHRFIDTSRQVTEGLLALERRYRAKDYSVYPLLYSQGATLWYALDAALLAAGSTGLDVLVPELVKGTFASNGDLPPAFVERLEERLGDRAMPILHRYLYLE